MPNEYQCIDPELGEQMSSLNRDDLDPRLRRQLEHHLEHCDACREKILFERALVRLIAEGAVEVPPPPSLRWVAARAASWAAPAAAALCIMLAVFLAPSPEAMLGGKPAGGHRALVDEALVVTRPVDGETRGGGPVALAWTPVAGARRYAVRVTQIDGDYTWSGETADARLALPGDAPVPGEYMAVVEAAPEGVAPGGPAVVRYHRDRAGAVLAWRLNHLPPASRWLALAALVLGATALVLRRL
ncbi:MAG: hypothetical protein JW819_06615 [Candidatus Krumholzibacteriota bacterium]|nr:hypothetical protein [Candidatus Krumholzibacteriota bacterium]